MGEERKTLQYETKLYLDELSEVPREISGSLTIAVFTDSNVWEHNMSVVLLDPIILNQDGQLIELDTRRDRRYFIHPNYPDNQALILKRWVVLKQLISKLETIGGRRTPIKINLSFEEVNNG